jgi:hypothetical protein
MTGLDFSIGIDTDDDGLIECGTGEGQEPHCEMEAGAPFRVRVHLHALPPTAGAYQGFQAIVLFSGVTSAKKSDVLWRDCAFPATHYKSTFLAYACAGPVGGVTSSYVGPMGESLFECTGSGSVTLRHGPGNTAIAQSQAIFFESSANEQIMITCGEPLSGDVDCSVAVTSVDAQLTLQDVAGAIEDVPCPQLQDVNLDRESNAIDSLITLQHTAGLVPSLPILPDAP